MRHAVARIAVFALLGIVVNTVIAWTCFLLVESVFDTKPLSLTEADLEWWRRHAPPDFPAEPSWFNISSALGYSSRNYSWARPGMVPHPCHLQRSSAGLPFRSLYVVVVGTLNESGDAVVFRSAGLGGSSFLLPLRPAWAGFIANSLFFGAALWLFAAAVVHARLRVRLARGRCPICGCLLRDSPICPECGTTTTSTNRSVA